MNWKSSPWIHLWPIWRSLISFLLPSNASGTWWNHVFYSKIILNFISKCTTKLWNKLWTEKVGPWIHFWPIWRSLISFLLPSNASGTRWNHVYYSKIIFNFISKCTTYLWTKLWTEKVGPWIHLWPIWKSLISFLWPRNVSWTWVHD